MVELFFVLLICGLILIGTEVFVPGGIIGSVGAMALLGAVLTGFSAFGPVIGGWIAVGVLFLVGVVIWLWVRFFPTSRIGQKMTVSQDLGAAVSAPEGLKALLGKSGTAVSELRPAGIALIDGRRADVVTDGIMIRRNEPIRVVRVEGVRVVVARASTGEAAKARA